MVKEYKLEPKLLQAIVAILEELPAKNVRGILNSIEVLVIEQDKQEVKE
jgi:hypothetical protein